MKSQKALDLGMPHKFIRIPLKELFPNHAPTSSKEIIEEAEKTLRVRVCTDEEIKEIISKIRNFKKGETIYIPFEKTTQEHDRGIMATGNDDEGFGYFEGERSNREVANEYYKNEDLVFVSLE